MTDPIADMLSQIRNALAVHKSEVVLPYSKVKLAIAKILVGAGYLTMAEIIEKSKGSSSIYELKVGLKYLGREPAISNLKRISKPGRRVYQKAGQLPVVLNNLGLAIISTPQGIMTNKEAKKRHLGGEIICEVY